MEISVFFSGNAGKIPSNRSRKVDPMWIGRLLLLGMGVLLQMVLISTLPLGVGRPLLLAKKTDENLAALCSQHIGILPHPNLIHKMLIVGNQW